MENFQRSWEEYKTGFGSPSGEQWLGNDILNQLTTSESNEVYVRAGRFGGEEKFSKYANFRVGNETTNFTANVGLLLSGKFVNKEYNDGS